MATRRNRSSTRRRRNIGLSRRRNTARRTTSARRRRNGLVLRSNSAMLTIVMRQGQMSRAKAKALKKSNYKKFRALYEKAGGETARKAHQGSRGERWTKVQAKWASEKEKRAKAKGTKSKSTRKGSAAKRKTTGRKMSRWAKFQKSKKGLGWSSSKMSEMYQKEYGATNPRRKNTRKNTARRSTYSRRKNTGRRSFSLRSNQGATGIMPIDATTKVVDSIPVVGGWVGPYVAPMAIGALSGGASFYLMRELGPKLPAKLQPYGYSLGGVLGGTVVAALPIGKVSARRLVAAGMVTVGAAIDLYRYLMGRSAEEAEASTGAEASADEALSGFGAWEYTGKGYAGLALDRQNPYAGLALDEGRQSNPYGAWEYTGQGALNNPGYGALELVENSGYGAYEYTGDGALNGYGAWGDYADASFGDARYAPRYFSQHERHAARSGANAWRQYFGQSPRQMRRTRQAHSRHAGRPGHRWGWMIKLIGPEGMKQLAAMEPRQAVGVIDGLKAKALQALPELIQQAQSTDAEAMSLPPTDEIMSATNGVSGANGAQGVGGFGSLLFSGNPF